MSDCQDDLEEQKASDYELAKLYQNSFTNDQNEINSYLYDARAKTLDSDQYEEEKPLAQGEPEVRVLELLQTQNNNS